MRVCNHGCNVTLSVSPAHFKAVSLTLKYKYYGIQMKNTFPSFDLEIDHLFPSEPRKESKRKKNNSACVSNLDDLFEGAQAKTTKYATKYAVNVFKVIFAFNYYNKILTTTYCFFKKNCTIKLNANSILRVFWNQILHGRSVAVFGCQMFKK